MRYWRDALMRVMWLLFEFSIEFVFDESAINYEVEVDVSISSDYFF